MRRHRWLGFVAALPIMVSGCRRYADKANCDQSIPTIDAVDAFHMQGECVALGKLLLNSKTISQNMAKDQVSKYNAADNRCYVLVGVRDAISSDNREMTSEDSLYDGQTGELLAVVTGRGGQLGLGLLDDSIRPLLSDPKNPYEVWKLAEKFVRTERKTS